ncbi:hypothetical protein BC937DRAFT_87614 [Endogone sp. FLAS-F59071]|nr:hypothetical protein BC937DRAFT_87614 [Endogone sp. FLAS-F59071]|eukprot:RUS19357.1 hypothetical protein BC937DRAFT_87614 [Endogone sp. FLAS-F59071]
MRPKVISSKRRACEHSHRRSILIDTYTYLDKITDQSKLPLTLDENDLFSDFWDTLPKCLQDKFVNAVEILEENAKKANTEVFISKHTLCDEAIDHECKVSTTAPLKHRNLQFISNDQDFIAENALRATVFTTPSPEHSYLRGVSRLINDRDNDKDDDETVELRHVSPLLLSSGSPDPIFANMDISPLGSNNLGERNNSPHFRRVLRPYSSWSSVNQALYSRLNETPQHDKPTTPVYRTFAQCGKRKFIDMCIDEQQSTAVLDKNAQTLEKIYYRDPKVTGHSQHYSGHIDLSKDIQWSPSLETPERPSASGTNRASPGLIMQSLRDSAAEQMREFGAEPSDSPSERDPIGSENDHSNIMKWPHSLLSELDDEARQTSFEIGFSSDGNLAQQMKNKSRTVSLSDIDIPDEKQTIPTNFLFDRPSDLKLSCHISSPPYQSNLHCERSYFQREYPGSPSLRKGYQEGIFDGCGSKGDHREHEKSRFSPKPLSSLVNIPILLHPETSPTVSSIQGSPWPQSLVHHKRIRNDVMTDDKENRIAAESEEKIARITTRIPEKKNSTDCNALAANSLSARIKYITMAPEKFECGHSDDVVNRLPLLLKMDQSDSNRNENGQFDDFGDDFDLDSLDQVHKATQELSSVDKQTSTDDPKAKGGEISVDLSDDPAKLDPAELVSRVNKLTSIHGGFQTGRQQGIHVQISTKTVSEMFKTLEPTTSSHDDIAGPFGGRAQNTTSDSTSRGEEAIVNRLSRPMTLKMMAKDAHRSKNSMKSIEFNALMASRNGHVDPVVMTSRSDVELAQTSKLADLTSHYSRPFPLTDDSVLKCAAQVSTLPQKTSAHEMISPFPSTSCRQAADIDVYLDVCGDKNMAAGNAQADNDQQADMLKCTLSNTVAQVNSTCKPQQKFNQIVGTTNYGFEPGRLKFTPFNDHSGFIQSAGHSRNLAKNVDQKSTGPSISGFTSKKTWSTPSALAMERAKRLFTDIDDGDNCQIENLDSLTSFGGFRSANEKEIVIPSKITQIQLGVVQNLGMEPEISSTIDTKCALDYQRPAKDYIANSKPVLQTTGETLIMSLSPVTTSTDQHRRSEDNQMSSMRLSFGPGNLEVKNVVMTDQWASATASLDEACNSYDQLNVKNHAGVDAKESIQIFSGSIKPFGNASVLDDSTPISLGRSNSLEPRPSALSTLSTSALSRERDSQLLAKIYPHVAEVDNLIPQDPYHDEQDEIMALNSTLGHYGGFTTANGKKATAISTKALCDAFAVFSRDSQCNKPITTDRIFPPQTATKAQPGDLIECSAPIITRSGHQMDELNTLTSDAQVGLSNDIMKPPRHLEISAARNPLPNGPTVMKFNGFATASGKPMPAISADRLKEAQAKLLDSYDSDFMEFPQTGNLSDDTRMQLGVNLYTVPTCTQYNSPGVMTTSDEAMQPSKQTSIGIYKQGGYNHSSDKTFTVGEVSLPATPEKPESLSISTTDLCHNGMPISKSVPITNRTRIGEIPVDLHRNLDLLSSSISNCNTSKATPSGSPMNGSAHQLRSLEVTKSIRTPHLTSTSLRRRTNLNTLDGSLAGGKVSTSPAIRLRSSALKSSRYRPFRSPLRSDRIISRPVETEAIGSANVFKAASLVKMTTLFDLTSIGNRQKLDALVARRPLELGEKELLLMHKFELLSPLDVVHMTSSLAQHFHFGTWGSMEARGAILDVGALPQYATPNWVNNHYRWIVWKLACMVRNYPEHFREWWCASKVIEQLRYEREINHAHRSAIKRIVEQDDTASKHMVLCVADILDGHKADIKGEISNGIESDSKTRSVLELTDGWYRIFATVDKVLQRAVVKGKIKIGSKLSICGAQLSGSTEPTPVLEISMSKLLTISANGTKPVSWDTKLGYQKQPIVSRSLSSLCCDGGLIPFVDVVIMRKYPLAFNEILSDGSIVTRTAREEDLAEREHEAYKEKQLELIIAEVERKMTQTRRSSFQPIVEHDCLQDLNVDTAQELHQMFIEGQDETAFYESLISKQQEKRAEIDQKINEKINERQLDRKVSAFFKVKLCDYPKRGGLRKRSEASLIIGNANASKFDELHEGRRYHIYTLTALAKHDRVARADAPWTDSIRLKTTPKTKWREIDLIEGILETSMYCPRIVSACNSLSEREKGGEVDLVVIILDIASPIKSQAYGRSSLKQTMLVTDATEQIVQIEFSKLTRGIQNLCKIGDILGIKNLRYSLYDPKYAIYTLKASDDIELYQANSTCRVTYLALAIEELDRWIKAEPNRLKNLKEQAAVLTGQLTPIL